MLLFADIPFLDAVLDLHVLPVQSPRLRLKRLVVLPAGVDVADERNHADQAEEQDEDEDVYLEVHL